MRKVRRKIKRLYYAATGFFIAIGCIYNLFQLSKDHIDSFAKTVIQEKEQSIVENINIDVSGDINIINNNIPYFTEEEKQRTDAFEFYSELDILGRCSVAYANICKELMPTEERGEIGHIKPSGWMQAKYDNIDSNPGYLYNRCHLIAFCLAGENDNEKNLITGTRFFNVEMMLPYETMVAEYIDSHPDNHVLYRVTPVFENNNLVASGVIMEAWSVEDNGQICFNVYLPNIQPGITIDYATGKSSQN